MAWHGSIEVRSSEGGRVLVLYRGEARVYDLETPDNAAKLKRIASTNHSAAMQFLSRFPRVPDAEKAHVEALKTGSEMEFKAILDSIKSVVEPKRSVPAPKKKGGK